MCLELQPREMVLHRPRPNEHRSQRSDRQGSDTTVYDTGRPGYRNTGHTFAAGLTDAQRRDLLEYLKTL